MLTMSSKSLTSGSLCLCSVSLSVSVCGIDNYISTLHVVHLVVVVSCLSVCPIYSMSSQPVLPLMSKMLATMAISTFNPEP